MPPHDDIYDAIKFYLENYREITERFHGEEPARKAMDDWLYQFNNRKPIDIEDENDKEKVR